MLVSRVSSVFCSKQFASLDENQKEEMKRERRRIQEQLRRIKRNEAKLAAKAEIERDGAGGKSMKKKKENLKEIKVCLVLSVRPQSQC